MIQRSSRCQGADAGTLHPTFTKIGNLQRGILSQFWQKVQKNLGGSLQISCKEELCNVWVEEKSAYWWGEIHGHETKLITLIKVEAGLTHLWNTVHHMEQAGTRHALNMLRGTVSPNCKFKEDKQHKKSWRGPHYRWGHVREHFLIHLSLQHYCLIRNCCYPIL